MPPIKSIDTSDGVRIEGCDKSVQIRSEVILSLPGDKDGKETSLNNLLQQQYESKFELKEFDPDHRVRQHPPILRPWERIESNELVVTTMYIKAHIDSLDPLKIVVQCQNKEAGPIYNMEIT